MDTEQTEVQAEVTEKAPEMEQKQEVSQEAEQVSETPEPTFTQADIDAKVAERETEWQSRKDKEFQPLKDENDKLKQADEDSKLKTLEEREITQWGDTPEVKELQAERRQVAKDKHDTEVLAAKTAWTNFNLQANEYASKYGIDKASLLESESPGEMRVKALEMALEKKEGAEVEKAPQVVDSGVQSIPGVDFGKMTPKDMIKWSLEHPTKK